MDIWRKLGTKFTVGDGCWEWTASKTPLGYGKMQVSGKMQYAHRIVYELLVGPIPEGLELDHLCRNRGCVRPDHLEPVTHTENVRRGTVGEWQLAKTHCPAGHPYSADNLIPSAAPRRRCKTCHNARVGRRYRERKAEV